jgi:hypothetical protein
MKTILWVIGISAITAAGSWMWLRWVNMPLNEAMSVARTSTDGQVEYIKQNYKYRLVRIVSTSQPDVFSPWAIQESNRRTLVIAAAWLALAIVWM